MTKPITQKVDEKQKIYARDGIEFYEDDNGTLFMKIPNTSITTTNKQRMYLHGECVILEIYELPRNRKKCNAADSIVISDSETAGNEHRILAENGIKFYKNRKGIIFMKNEVPATVYCKNDKRHESMNIPEGVWKIYKAVEYDYYSKAVVDVRD